MVLLGKRPGLSAPQDALMTKSVHMGLIGCGHWGPNYLRILSQEPQIASLCCFDPDKTTRERIQTLYPKIRFFSRLEDMLNQDVLDACIVASPAHTHFQLTQTLLKSGRDVLCEKPLTLKYAQACELVELAKRHEKILMVGHTFVYNTGIQTLRSYVQSGELGEPYYMASTRTNLGPVRSDVNALGDLAVHDFSIFQFLLGSNPTSVAATGQSVLQSNLADTAFITCQYPQDIMAHAHVSWLNPLKVRQLTLVGSRKMIIWDDLNREAPLKIYEAEIVNEPFYEDFGQFQLLPQRGEVRIPRLHLQEPLKNQVQDFIQSVLNRTEPLSGGAFGANIVRILEKANMSLQNGGRAIFLEEQT